MLENEIFNNVQNWKLELHLYYSEEIIVLYFDTLRHLEWQLHSTWLQIWSIKSIFSPVWPSVPVWVLQSISSCLQLSSPSSLSPSSEMTPLSLVSIIIVTPSLTCCNFQVRLGSSYPRDCLPSCSSWPREARPPPLVYPPSSSSWPRVARPRPPPLDCLPSCRPSLLDQALSNNYPSFLLFWVGQTVAQLMLLLSFLLGFKVTKS